MAYSQASHSIKISNPIVCKLTGAEMPKRKATVIASLKQKLIEKKELAKGFSYKFTGSDALIDELAAFIKTERLCCAFFDFSLRIKGDGSAAWLSITGPKGSKKFILSEMEL